MRHLMSPLDFTAEELDRLMDIAEELDIQIWLLMKENQRNTNTEDLVEFIEAKSSQINEFPKNTITNVKRILEASFEMAG